MPLLCIGVKVMTVSELIEELQKYPMDMQVGMYVDYGLSPVEDTQERTLRKGTDTEHTFVELNSGVIS